MSTKRNGPKERQLRRQSIWLRDSIAWIMREKVLDGDRTKTALDVGCGPGFVMEVMEELADVRGVDIDEDMVMACRAHGLDVERASAFDLPFGDGSFDIVYCTFLMLWLEDPISALAEMSRVSRDRVLCLAEPDFGARIDYPEDLEPVRNLIIDGIKRRGGDPEIGRKLRELYRRIGLMVEVGTHPGVWSLERLRQESKDEWNFVEEMVPDGVDISDLKTRWERSLKKGTLFQYSPIFYALGSKTAI
jgi:ubiquinone/menaquinone biosynthesis C-methylase UbiE